VTSSVTRGDGLRILHVANFCLNKYGDMFYNIDRKISNGLIRNGHLVYEFSYRDVARAESIFKTTRLGGKRPANRRLLETFSRFRPDLLLLGHSELIKGETLDAIRRQDPRARIALWYIDPMFNEKAIQHVVDRLGCFDAVFATTGGEWLRKFKGSTNVAAFFPNPVDPAIECHRSFEQKAPSVDLLFCGSEAKGSDRERMLKQLRTELTDIRFEVYGSLGQPGIFGHAYFQKLQQTKMALNFSRRDDVYLYSSDRISQLTGNGVLTLTNRIPGYEMLYAEDEMAYFDGIVDLLEKIRYYCSNDKQRRELAARGWQRAHESLNSQRVAKYMLEVIFNEPFTEPYEWQDEKIA